MAARRRTAAAADAVRVRALLEAIERAYDARSWHGAGLKGCLRGVDADGALRRPGPDRHNIHEQVLHAAYWKYTVCRRLLGEAAGGFDEAGTNWFLREGPADEERWRTDRATLDRRHRALLSAVSGLADADLDRRPASGTRPSGRGPTVGELLTGIAAHDVYHAGQIQLIRRLVDA